MKHRILFLLFVMASCCSIAAKSYYSNSYYNANHFLTFGVGGGYSMMFEDVPELASFGNAAGTIDFGYEYRIKGFWIDLSAELQYLSSTSTYNISGTEKMIYDTQGKQALMHYAFDQYFDKQEFLFVNLPVVFGFYHRGFYLGAGAKIGYCIRAKESTALQYSTSATYMQYIEDFESMDDHFYSTYSVYVSESINSKYKLSAVAEIGYDVLSYSREMNHRNSSGLKISVVAEYGLNNLINANGGGPLYSFNENNAAELFVHPFYNTNAAKSCHINPLYVGMRISWIFNLESNNCPRCNVSENHRNFNKRYKRIQR